MTTWHYSTSTSSTDLDGPVCQEQYVDPCVVTLYKAGHTVLDGPVRQEQYVLTLCKADHTGLDGPVCQD